MKFDPATLTSDQLVDLTDEMIAGHTTYVAREAVVEELRRRLSRPEEDVFVLPVAVTEAIRSNFGSGRRTFDAVSKRVRFAYKVWQGKYGPWTPEQADYAEEIVVFCINKASAGMNPGHARAIVYTWLDKAVHHENTDAGFKSRQEEQVSILADLKEVLA